MRWRHMASENTFAIVNHGCSRRGLDAGRIGNFFLANGWKEALRPARARVVVVVTCGLTEGQIEKTLRSIADFNRMPGRLIVCGCMPAMVPERIRKVFKGECLAVKDMGSFDRFFPGMSVPFSAIKDSAYIWGQAGQPSAGRSTMTVVRTAGGGYRLLEQVEGRWGGIGFNGRFAAVRISEGCLGTCSYCSIRKAIGRLKSKPLDLIGREVEALVAARQFRINIASSDSGSYGLDIGSSFPQALRCILAQDRRVVIEYIQDLNPFWIERYRTEMLGILRRKRIRSMLVPIQSGSSRVLGLMRRPLDIGAFGQTLKKMKAACPELRVRTQVIVGFPGETPDDFRHTLEFLRDSPIDQVDIFPYFEVRGTPARSLKPKVPCAQIKQRLRILTGQAAGGKR